MSDIIWGEPIAVDGKRPEWLEDDVRISGRDGMCDMWWILLPSAVTWRPVTAIRLPADHPHYANPDDWQPCERTVRVCIEALPNMGTGKHLYSLRALEALIPNSDPAEMLVEEYKDTRHGFPVIHNHDVWSEIERFARHLINTGRIRP